MIRVMIQKWHFGKSQVDRWLLFAPFFVFVEILTVAVVVEELINRSLAILYELRGNKLTEFSMKLSSKHEEVLRTETKG